MEFVATPIGCFTFAVSFTAPVATLRKIGKILRQCLMHLQLKPPGFDLCDFLLEQRRFLRYTFSPPLLLWLEFWRVFAAGFLATDDRTWIKACVSHQFVGISFPNNCRMDCIAHFLLGKNPERPWESCFGRNLSTILPATKSSQTRISFQIFNQPLRRRKVIDRFQKKRSKQFFPVFHRTSQAAPTQRVGDETGRFYQFYNPQKLFHFCS